jgi:protein-tyrosine phosphatase
MAEGLLKARLSDDIVEWVIVRSAGTMGLSGVPASDGAVRVSAEHGIDISGHRSIGLDGKLIDEADLILAMAPFHREWVRSVAPGAIEKTHLLGSFGVKGTGAGDMGVEDPIGAPLEVYRRCFECISGHLDRCSLIIEDMVRVKIGRGGGRWGSET